MVDRFGREITQLRVSVTERCNLDCVYCTPPERNRARRDTASRRDDTRPDPLSFEEIADVVRAAVRIGMKRVRLTGGEPLMRPDVDALVSMLAAIDGIEDLAMSTNGTLLAGRAQALARAGLRRVNISLDSIDPVRYRAITRGGELSRVLAGIEAARNAGLEPIKLNCVVESSSDEPDAIGVARFARENSLEVRFIRRMDFRAGKFGVVQGAAGGDCARCSRLRLTSDGYVRPCLFSDLSFSVRELGGVEALVRAVQSKPQTGGPCSQSWIRVTGG
ncbi:MAG: GTP 3',8-cyclase MoaA [Armatimonadota bacterium]